MSFCAECSPTHQLNHFRERLFDRFVLISEYCFEPLVPRPLKAWADRVITRLFFGTLRAGGILRERPVTQNTIMHHRTRVVVDELERRGLNLNVLSIGKFATNFFVLRTPNKIYNFEGLPGLDPVTTITMIDNKEVARGLFHSLGAPTAVGAMFTKLKPALTYARTLGWPLVVKPQSGSLSAHTFVNIKTEMELETAIKSVQQIRRRFIVEQFINGSLYRAVTVGDKLVACGRRDPPYVIGDGVHTVQELFNACEQERHAMLINLGYKLADIPELPASHMAATPETILPVGEKLTLTWKINVSFGATVTDVTDQVHPDNRALFEKIAVAAKLPCLGIDFIAPDISVSWRDQICACIELNSLPAIDLHYPPIIIGQTQNIAGALLDYVLI